MDKKCVKQMHIETMTEEEQHIICLFSVICTEGVSMFVLYNILKPDNPRAFNTLVEKLCERSLLFCDHQTVYCDHQIAATVLDIIALKAETVVKVLTVLRGYLVLRPLDDMISRQEYFVVARLLLTYLMKQWKVSYHDSSQLIPLLSDAIITFSTNVELSFFGNKRQPVHRLEDRIDFRLLTLLKGLDGSRTEGKVYRLLGELYTSIFRYDEAKECFQKAETYLGEDSNLLFAQATMYENIGIPGKAFQYAYRAYLMNKEYWNNDENIKICLYIAYLCAVNKSSDNSKYWRNIARSLMGDRAIPACHIFSITLKEIEALLHLKDKALAFQILDSAELDVYKLYGGNAPEIARISFIRSLVEGETGRLRKRNEQYRRYENINHLNYGYSEVAPGVRLSQAFSNDASNLTDEDIVINRTCLEVAQRIYEDELRPNEEILCEIAPVFHHGVIPKSVLMTEEYGIINIITINICIGEGRFDDAKELIEELARNEKDNDERLKWHIHLGRTLIKKGELDDGLNVWRYAVAKTSNAHKFKIAKAIAEWAHCYSLNDEAMNFYEEALQTDTMVYGKTCDIAEALQCYADVLESCGSKGKSDELWKEAILLMRSMGDNDGIARLYYSWGKVKQGYEAECLLKKAIELWEPEPDIYDELLSKMYYNLCCAQAMQGKIEEARYSAHKAIELYPTEFPLNSLRCIEAYL